MLYIFLAISEIFGVLGVLWTLMYIILDSFLNTKNFSIKTLIRIFYTQIPFILIIIDIIGCVLTIPFLIVFTIVMYLLKCKYIKNLLLFFINPIKKKK